MRRAVDVIADALAHDPHVTLTGSTESEVARRLIGAIRLEYGNGGWGSGDLVIPVPDVWDDEEEATDA